MKKILFLCLLALAGCFMPMNGKNITGSRPDFAFPRKVETTAQSDLDRALTDGNSPQALNALIRWSLAKVAVSADSLPSVLGKIEAVKARTSDEAALSLMNLLEARIYTGAYQSDRWTYDQRPANSDVAGTDYRLWSRVQFSGKVKSLVDAALQPRAALLAMPLTDFDNVIEYERDALTFYPTLYDFAASQAIDCLTTFADRNAVLPVALLADMLDQSLYPANASGVNAEILGIYRSLILGRDGTAPAVRAQVDMIDYICPRLFGTVTPVATYLRRYAPTSDSRRNDAFMEAYRRNITSPYAVEFLLQIRPDGQEQKKTLYGLLSDFAAKNPDYFNINEVKNRLSGMSAKTVRTEYAAQGVKGGTLPVKVTADNVNAVTLKLVDVTSVARAARNRSQVKLTRSQIRPVSTVEVSLEGEVPFFASRMVEFKLPRFGLFAVVADFAGRQQADVEWVDVVSCSNLTGSAMSKDGKSTAIVADAESGAPVDGASIRFTPWNRKIGTVSLPGKTDREGMLALDVKEYGQMEPQLGEDVFAPGCSVYHSSDASDGTTRYGANIFTSLKLYRPGDVVDFSAAVYSHTSRGGNTIAQNETFTAVLRDANYQSIDTLTLTTDSWGRIQGAFSLPKAGLTGNYSIELGKGDKTFGYTYFTVSDYKLPTFMVEIKNVERPANTADNAVIEGMASTFAGFPVAEATVKASVKVRSGYWFYASVSPVFFETETTTGADGTFRIVIPAEAIASSPNAAGYFMVDVAVVSPDGETQQASTGFNMGKPLNITVNIPQIYIPETASASVTAVDGSGKDVSVQFAYTVKRCVEKLYNDFDDDPSFEDYKSGECASGSIDGLLSSLPSGKYVAEFIPVDSALADKAFSGEFVVYRKADKACPVQDLLWLPESEVVADADGKFRITFGTAVEHANVLLTLCTLDSTVVEHRWLRDVNGMRHVDLKLPSVESRVRVYLRTVSRLHSMSASIDVFPASTRKKIEITTETFRDKVIPGSEETITFRIKGIDGAAAESAVLLDMSNKAIDILESNPLRWALASHPMGFLSVDGWSFTQRASTLRSAVNYLKNNVIVAPEFNLYGRSFMPERVFNLARQFRSTNYTMKAMGTEEAEAEDAIVTMDQAAPSAQAKMALAGSADGVVAESAMDEGTAEETPSAAETDDAAQYRPSEIPLAFFRPMLVTDADGTLSITYTVPDANTTWVLRALAYNRNLLSATTQADVVASKPLMVSANAPRFLRTSDKVVMQASVMNATDSMLCASTTLQVVDFASGKVLTEVTSTDSIAAGGRAVVGIPYSVLADVQGVLLRVKSTAGTFTDGEQALVAVLPSDQDVVESQMFYLAPGQQSYTTTVEPVGDGRAFLKFTENPAWEVVSALPGLRENKINSSIEAASALFSASVAEGLMRSYPEVARALRAWSENPSDSALVSELSKNSELKSILLNSTPWVSDALSQTQRMQRLVLLLDKRNTSAAIENAIAELARTYQSDGGWSWTPNYPEISDWSTEMVLQMLGQLNRLGWLPSDRKLGSMIEGSLKRLDRVTAERYAKHRQGDFTDYAYVRSMFPAVKQSSAGARVTAAVVRRVLGDWTNGSVTEKAVDALILNANGYNATARKVVASLKEYATVTPEKGMWWQQLDRTFYAGLDKVGCTALILDAFTTVTPGSPDIDRIRQWLVLQKTNNDWGSGVCTSKVVASILMSGTDWNVNPAGTAIHIGSTLVEPAKEEAFTGSFTQNITPLVREGAQLTIDRQANYPSFGAVLTMRCLPMHDVKAAGSAELSVEKSLNVYRDGQWVPSRTFSTGDRVQVSLVLKVESDLSYVVIQDNRAATFEPVEQLPRPVASEGLWFYQENRDASTNLFIDRLPRGTYMLTYELFATQGGTFASGVASVQSLYNPAMTAHSSGDEISVK